MPPSSSDRRSEASSSTETLPTSSGSTRALRPDDLHPQPEATTVLGSGGGAPNPSAPPSSRLPVLAERFQMLNIIGYGSYGMVFRGLDLLTQLPVAIKILKSDCYGDDFVERHWRSEQALASRLQIRGAPRGFAAGDETHKGSRVSYLVTELIDGQTLRDWRAELNEAPSPDDLLDILRKIADALCELKAIGIVHRDLKPGNIMRSDDGTIKVMDFGLHRHIDDPPPTTTDRMAGTPQYLPPELLAGAPGGFEGDIYSMGITLFALLEGEVPFLGESIADVLRQHRTEPLPLLSPPWRGGPLDDLLREMTSKDPAQRPSIEALRDLLADPSFTDAAFRI